MLVSGNVRAELKTHIETVRRTRDIPINCRKRIQAVCFNFLQFDNQWLLKDAEEPKAAEWLKGTERLSKPQANRAKTVSHIWNESNKMRQRVSGRWR